MSERATQEQMRQWMELEVWLRAMSGLVESERRAAGWQQGQRIRPLAKLLEEAVHRVGVLAEDAAYDVEQAARGVCEDCGVEGDPDRLHDYAGADRCSGCIEDHDEARREDAHDSARRDAAVRSQAALPWAEVA